MTLYCKKKEEAQSQLWRKRYPKTHSRKKNSEKKTESADQFELSEKKVYLLVKNVHFYSWIFTFLSVGYFLVAFGTELLYNEKQYFGMFSFCER